MKALQTKKRSKNQSMRESSRFVPVVITPSAKLEKLASPYILFGHRKDIILHGRQIHHRTARKSHKIPKCEAIPAHRACPRAINTFS